MMSRKETFEAWLIKVKSYAIDSADAACCRLEHISRNFGFDVFSLSSIQAKNLRLDLPKSNLAGNLTKKELDEYQVALSRYADFSQDSF